MAFQDSDAFGDQTLHWLNSFDNGNSESMTNSFNANPVIATPQQPNSAKSTTTKAKSDRSLVRWTVEQDELLLVAIQYECRLVGVRIPWEKVALHFKKSLDDPGPTAGAIEQHIAKLGKKVNADVGPPTRRRKVPIKQEQLQPPESDANLGGMRRRRPTRAGKKRTPPGKGPNPDDASDPDDDFRPVAGYKKTKMNTAGKSKATGAGGGKRLPTKNRGKGWSKIKMEEGSDAEDSSATEATEEMGDSSRIGQSARPSSGDTELEESQESLAPTQSKKATKLVQLRIASEKLQQVADQRNAGNGTAGNEASGIETSGNQTSGNQMFYQNAVPFPAWIPNQSMSTLTSDYYPQSNSAQYGSLIGMQDSGWRQNFQANVRYPLVPAWDTGMMDNNSAPMHGLGLYHVDSINSQSSTDTLPVANMPNANVPVSNMNLMEYYPQNTYADGSDFSAQPSNATTTPPDSMLPTFGNGVQAPPHLIENPAESFFENSMLEQEFTAFPDSGEQNGDGPYRF